MERCPVCSGRMMSAEFGLRCMNSDCGNSTEVKKEGHLCIVCGAVLVFKRNNGYGDRTYWCPECKKESTY